MIIKQLPDKYLEFFIISTSALLLAIWTLPGTIAFRNILLVFGFVTSFAYLIHCWHIIISRNAWPLWILLGFFIWMLFHLFFLSSQFALQKSELLSVWLRSFLASILGLSAGLILINFEKVAAAFAGNKDSIFSTSIFFLGLSGVCIISFFFYIFTAFNRNQIINYEFDIIYNLYKSKTPFVIAATFFLPLCYTIIIKAINLDKKKIYILFSTIGITLTLLTCIFSNTKNGVTVFIFVMIIFLPALLFKIHWNFRRIILIFLVLFSIGAITFYSVRLHLDRNDAWPNLIADARVATDIENYDRWKNRDQFPLPNNALGSYVNQSTYERLAWFTAGIRLIQENPLGFGLIHHSFGWLAKAKWSDFYEPKGNLRGATHSGWLDMALGIGLPGILLIWISLAASWKRCFGKSGIWFSYTFFTIPTLMLSYLITEVAGQHSTELLFFMTALFCGFTLEYPAMTTGSDRSNTV
jgi:hypothetical protein